MQKNLLFPMALITVAMLAGCNSMPKSAALSDAHIRYNNALNTPEVTNLAALELKEASDSLTKADAALSKGESNKTVEHLAYLANQQVEIAQATAKRKTAEIAVTNAGVERDQVRLEARTNEADAAKQQVQTLQTSSDQQAAALAIAGTNAERDKNQLAASSAETDAAKQQVSTLQKTSDQQTTDLALAGANAERDKALIAQQEILLKEFNAKKTERGLVITLNDVLFNTNKAQLKARGIHNVQKLAGFLTQYPLYKVSVEGHTDSVGSSDHNQLLSEQRATSVQTALVNSGISIDRISTHGYGEELPAVGNNTAASRQLNRRVEIILSDDKGHISQR